MIRVEIRGREFLFEGKELSVDKEYFDGALSILFTPHNLNIFRKHKNKRVFYVSMKRAYALNKYLNLPDKKKKSFSNKKSYEHIQEQKEIRSTEKIYIVENKKQRRVTFRYALKKIKESYGKEVAESFSKNLNYSGKFYFKNKLYVLK